MKNGRLLQMLVIVAAAATLAACGHAMMLSHGTEARRPDLGEFGGALRSSAEGRYVATLSSAQSLRSRQAQTIRVILRDDKGRAVDDAQILIDGGMPQRGRGLPTRPRVTGNLGNGVYEVEGVRFNMNGWWEFRLAIAGSNGNDVVTFNLDL